MTKLTNATRERIAEAATAFAFDDKQATLKIAADALAREAHAAIFPKAETDLIATIPDNWVRFDRCLRFNVAGMRIDLCMIDDGLPVPYKIGGYAGYSCKTLGAIEPGDLADRIVRHAQAVDETKKARQAAQKSVYLMLTKFTTVKKLREEWPEGAAFYAKYENAPAPTVPAIRVDEINSILGIAA